MLLEQTSGITTLFVEIILFQNSALMLTLTVENVGTILFVITTVLVQDIFVLSLSASVNKLSSLTLKKSMSVKANLKTLM
jgi:hypothetical protein